MDYKKIRKYIEQLNMDGLHGRMLRMPATGSNNKEILLLYGHHSSLERMFGFAELMSKYGNVTMPDLPGFGGMEPLYKKGIEPKLDAYADYLAAFIKLRYKRKKVVIVGFSYTVPLVVTMLQKYPDLQKRVEYIVGIVGFVHEEDFHIPRKYMIALKAFTRIGSNRVMAFIMKTFFFREFFIRAGYFLVGDKHHKMKGATKEDRKARIDFEVELWKINDLRTWMFTLNDMLKINVLEGKVKVPMHHASTVDDTYIDHKIVDQHMQIIFDDYTSYISKLPNHAPSIIASAKDVEPFIPKKLLKVLAKS